MTATATTPNIPGPRTPLTINDSGLYGGWNDYFMQKDNGFNFLVMQATIPANVQVNGSSVGSHGQENTTWNKALLEARAAGKRVIADVMVGIHEADVPLDHLKQQLDFFMAQVDEAELYAITLGEENVYWDGHREQLIELYKYAKANYDVPVYQWYSPYAGTPGFGWPALPADGWLLDEYAHLMPEYELFVREYKMTRLPLVSIVWAAPTMKDFEWKGRGDISLPEQMAVHRKYGIPSSYFCWSGKANIWAWHREAPAIDREVFAWILDEVKRLPQMSDEVHPDSWDNVPQPQPTVYLSCQLQPVATFSEDYRKSGGELVRSATQTGFRHLRYLGNGVEFAPDAAGDASASVTYKLRQSFPANSFKVRVSSAIAAGADVKIGVSISNDGVSWSADAVPDERGIVNIALPGASLNSASADVWVRVNLHGTATVAGQTLATINSLHVESEFKRPGVVPIQLTADQSGTLAYDEAFKSLSWLHTATVTNADTLVLQPGRIGQPGRAGSVQNAALVQEFNLDKPAMLHDVQVKANADKDDLGAVVRLSVSLDGKTPIASAETTGKFNGWLPLDEKSLQAAGKIQKFYVHLELINSSGAVTSPAWVDGLKIRSQTN